MQQQVGIGHEGEPLGRDTERVAEFRAVIEPQIGDQRETTVGAVQRLSVMQVLGQQPRQLAGQGDLAFVGGTGPVLAIDCQSPLHLRACGRRTGTAIESPIAADPRHRPSFRMATVRRSRITSIDAPWSSLLPG
ncbi:hypothetical protein [Rhizorhabdus phycosphaerae]|uniref:hypothetical protein n=1 Tax=Rhizorhabdus phycosphaerae TaxID=2711156 RepID=UPI001D01752D|nr:hypothetical protein [Rhizorhabdus phycosphaerae]